MIYFMMISLAVLLAFLADKTRGVLSGFFVICAMFVPCFFAGVRDVTIGTDVMTYGVWTYQAASQQSFLSFMKSYSTISAVGFNAFSWIVARTGSFALYLGAIQAMTICPLYLYVKRRYTECTWPAMAAYMLLLFPISLNVMKQMIAVSLCVLSYTFVERRKPIQFIAYILLISILFHQTAIVFVVFYPIGRLMLNMDSPKKAFFGRWQNFAIAIIVFLVFTGAFLCGNALIDVFSHLKESYSYQANAEGSRINYSALAMSVVLIVAYCTSRSGEHPKRADVLAKEQTFFGLICIIGSLAFQFNVIATSLLRFAYYLIAFMPLYLSSLICDRKRTSAVIAGSVLIAFLICYFLQVYAVNGGNAVYPYTSQILGVE
jgi:hypothetical protein